MAREEVIKTQCQSNLRQCAIALYAHAKNNGGMLPDDSGWQTELKTEGYIDTTGACYCPKVLTTLYEPQWSGATENLYGMASTDDLLYCPTPTHEFLVKAEGHVEAS